MDDALVSGQQSSLDSLRTVEFRQTLRGYHIDDVDEYLERVAIEADTLKEDLQHISDQLHQAMSRIAELEEKQYQEMLAPQPQIDEPDPVAVQSAQQSALQDLPGEQQIAQSQMVSDETLQRTLLLAQRFVDETKNDAENQAKLLISEAEERVKEMIASAEEQAKALSEDAGKDLRSEVEILESTRRALADETRILEDQLAQHRTKIQGSLKEMLSWLDGNLKIEIPASQASPAGASATASQRGSGVFSTFDGSDMQNGEGAEPAQTPAVADDATETQPQSSSGTVPAPGNPFNSGPGQFAGTVPVEADSPGRSPSQVGNGNLF